MAGKKKGIFGKMIEDMLYHGMMEAARDPKTGKVDPYAAAGIAFGAGKIKSVKDHIRFGAYLGAAGAFDPDPDPLDDPFDDDDAWRLTCEDGAAYGVNPYLYATEYEYLSALEEAKYAWRDDCEDGLEYGIDPEDYETAEEYEEALNEAKYAWRDTCEDGFEFDVDPEDYETEEEYEEALEEARYAWRDTCIDGSEYDIDPEDYETEEEYEDALEEAEEEAEDEAEDECGSVAELQIVLTIHEATVPEKEDEEKEETCPDQRRDEDVHQLQYTETIPLVHEAPVDPLAETEQTLYTFCGVLFPNCSTVYHYLTDDDTLSVGDLVVVPVGRNCTEKVCEIATVEKHGRKTAPYPVDKAKHILRRYEEGQDDSLQAPKEEHKDASENSENR